MGHSSSHTTATHGCHLLELVITGHTGGYHPPCPTSDFKPLLGLAGMWYCEGGVWSGETDSCCSLLRKHEVEVVVGLGVLGFLPVQPDH